MRTNMKLHVQIVLLLLTTASVFGSGALPFGLNLQASIYVLDDYGTRTAAYMSLIDTGLNASESNYPNTVKFYHYKRERGNNSVALYIGDKKSLRLGKFDPKIPTVLVTHGWLNNYLSPACTYIRDAYFEHGDYNVIVIDWGEIARDSLFSVASRVESIAKYVSKMLDFLVSQGMDPSNTTLVGHSFGAHLVGLASYYAKNKMNYIVGMDPAGPAFHDKGKGTKLSKDDGNYVLAIHTSSGLGSLDPVGHADFYPNGGAHQIGCIVEACSHIRSYQYFAVSVNNKDFLAHKCDNYYTYKLGLCKDHATAYMGGVTPDYNATGIYYLDTYAEPPFAKN